MADQKTIEQRVKEIIVNQLNVWFNEIERTDETREFLKTNGGDPWVTTPSWRESMAMAIAPPRQPWPSPGPALARPWPSPRWPCTATGCRATSTGGSRCWP